MATSDIGGNIIRAFEAGRRARMEREDAAQREDDRKLQREMLQHQIRQLGIEEKLQRRQAQLAAAGTMEGRPGTILPGTEATPGRSVSLEGALPGAPTFQTSPLSGIQPEELPHPPVGIEGIPELGVPGQIVQPQNFSEMLKGLALKKQIENVVSVPGVGEVDVRALPAITAHLNELATQRRQEETLAAQQQGRQEQTAAAEERQQQQQTFAARQQVQQQQFTATQNELARAQQEKLAQMRTTGTEKPPTAAENQNFNFYSRLNNAAKTALDLEGEIKKMGFVGQARFTMAPNFLQSQTGQLLQNAAREFTEARLRKESGAAIAEHEYENDRQTYFPVPGDTAKTLDRKRKARNVLLGGFIINSAKAYKQSFGDEVPIRFPDGTEGTVAMNELMKAISQGAEIIP